MQIGDLAGQAMFGIAKAQRGLATSTARLSSGLRITSAADDPSGLAIATGLQTQSMGLDAGQNAIQTAANAVTVADGALQSVQQILQRMRSMVVSGRSDLLSNADRANVNAVLKALGQELDRIASNTNFNGLPLLDGSLSTAPATSSGAVVARNDSLTSGAPLLDPAQLVATPTGLPVNMQISVDAYDPNTDLLTVSFAAASPDPSQTFLESQPQTTQIRNGQNYDDGYNALAALLGGSVASLFPSADQYSVADGNNNNILTFVMNNLSPSDVGKSTFIYTVNPTQPGGGALHIGLGDKEGDIVTVTMPGVSQANLNITETMVSSNDLVTQGSEYRLDAAIQSVGSSRASLGAQAVSLEATRADLATTSINLTASASAIRDADVAAETTTFTRLQITQSIASRLLASANNLDKLVVFELIAAARTH